jgi:D-sorbitol dehydrogenase (acceptor)
MRLQGKTALITGAARGIGRAFAEAYIREGARVAIADIDIDLARKTASDIGAAAIAVHVDVTEQDSIAAAVAETDERLGGIDILINNAAIFTAAPIVEIGRADYERVFAINVAGTLFTMASQAGRRGEGLVAVYCASKAAVISLTQSAGLDLIKHGINVNAIAPGVVDGDHWDGVDAFFAKYEGKAPGQKKKEVGEAVPYGRMGRAEDLTGMAVFLASDEADYIVAQTYNVDGGNWMN